MSKITSIEKGDKFEKQVFNIIKDLLDNGEFFVSGKRSRIFWKKKYYSEKTKSEVEVDISIETYLKDADKYSLLTVIECKNYKGNVPVNDIRELSSVLNEIGEHGTKGLLISNSSFQKGAIDFAKNSNIGLCRINPENDIDWINYRKDKKQNKYTVNTAELLLSSDCLKETNFFAYNNKKSFERLPDLLINLGLIDKYFNIPKFITFPYISEAIIENTILNIFDYTFYDKTSLNTQLICEKLTDLYNVDFNFKDNLSQSILGKIEFAPLRISITNSLLSDTNRWRFTFAHEIGHLVLHSKILNQYLESKIDRNDTLMLNQCDTLTNNKRLEIQANIFASILLMPKMPLLNYVKTYFEKENINKGYLYLDNQPTNRRLVFSFLNELQNYFGVSKEVAKYRLISFGILKDTTDISINGIIRKK